MRAHDYLWDMATRFAASVVAFVRGPEFSCGDCERNARCGLPPHKECLARVAQIARDGGRRTDRRTLIGF